MNAPQDLPTLLRLLASTLAPHVDDEAVDGALAAISPDADSRLAIEQALAGVGLRVRWMASEGIELLRGARPDLPLLGIDREDGHWWVVDRGSMGRVRTRSALWGEARWLAPGQLTEPSTTVWARVEPLLPASPWASGEGRTLRPIERVRGMLQSECSDVVVVVVYAILVGVLSLATPLAIQVLINQLAFGMLLQPILFLGLALLVCLTLAAGLMVAKRHVVEVIQRRVFVRAVSDLTARFTRVRIDKLDGIYAPELANRFFDVLTLQKATSALLLDGVSAVLQALVGFSLLAVYHPMLLLFDLFAVLLLGLALWPTGWGAESTAIRESKAKYAVAGWLEEIARHPLVFKLGGGQLGEHRADQLTRSYLASRKAHFDVFLRQYTGMQIANVVLPVVLMVSCGWLVLEGQLTLGQLVAAEFIMATAITGVSKFTEKLETVYDLLAGIDKLGALLDLEGEPLGGRHRSRRTDGATVALEGASFHGLGCRLAAVDLRIEPGRSLGVYGPAGSGKSTLGEIVLGVRRPTEGIALRDGMPIDSLAPQEIFEEEVLLRWGQVIQGPVEDNLLVGRSRSLEAVWVALESVGLTEAVRALPDGLSTVLDTQGQPLSESQMIDLLVARALLAKTRLVVVDGLFDGLAASHRHRLMEEIEKQSATLLVLTEEVAVAQACNAMLSLEVAS